MITNQQSRLQVLYVTHFLNIRFLQRRFQALIPVRPLVCQGLMESPPVLTVFFETSKRISRE